MLIAIVDDKVIFEDHGCQCGGRPPGTQKETGVPQILERLGSCPAITALKLSPQKRWRVHSTNPMFA